MTDASAWRLRLYLGGVYAVAVAALAWVFAGGSWTLPEQARGVLVVTTVLLIVAELFPIRLWSSGAFHEYTFSGTFALALLQTGPIVYAIIPYLCVLSIEEIRHRRPLRAAAFNLAQNILIFILVRLVISTVGGVRFGEYTDIPQARQVLGLIVAGLVYFFVNVGLTGAVLALSRNTPVRASIVTTVRKELSVTPIVLGLAPLVVASLRFSLWTAPICLLLLFVVRRLAGTSTEHQIASLHDQLTALPNRSLLLMRLHQALDEARRPRRKVAVLMIDLDRFKEVNDTLGHAAGDDLLRQVAARLIGSLNPDDTVARLGGDEFAIVLHDATERSAAAFAERLIASLTDAFQVDEFTLNIGASVGIALFPEHAGDPESLIRYADFALYTAKADRGVYAVYDPSSEVYATEQPVLMGELRRGIERGELVVHYQPKIGVANGRISSVEALVRWQHPTRGLLSPGQFLPAAETTGLIEPLTHEVFRQALTAVGQWRAAGLHISVAVNVSARQIADLDLPDQIGAALADHGLSGDVLIVEMTESCLMGDQLRSRTVLNRLRAAGIGLSVDDFGTGYSSFTHLRDLPMSEIKIDRSFVTDAAASPANAAIVKSTVELAHNLGLTVVAEGVESPPCLEMLTAVGCDLVQGYLFARPMPADDLVPWAAAQVQLVSAGRAAIPC